jgi:hypothetical protein
MVLIALLAGPGVSPTFGWLNPTFIWCLPLVAATGQLLPRQPRTAWQVAPRQFAVSLAVLSALWGYPVWGSQGMLSFFLCIPVAMVWCADACCYGDWPLGRIELLSSPRRQAGAMALSCLAALGIVGLSLVLANRAAKAYHRLEPAGLPGTRLVHMPRAQADFYRRLIQATRAHGRSFFTMPGLGSLYFWAEQNPPTRCSMGNWMTLLKPDEQSKVVEDLQKTPDLCVIRWDALVKFWTNDRDISTNKIVRYIEDNFVVVESFEGCDILVRRPAGRPTSGSPGRTASRHCHHEFGRTPSPPLEERVRERRPTFRIQRYPRALQCTNPSP